MNKKITATKTDRIIPSYSPKKPLEFPMFFENKPYQGASGRLYPIPFSDGITDEKKDVSYEVYTLENEYLKVDILPQIGGKVNRAYDKIGQYDFIYHNEVIKPALVGLAGAWGSGGIEFNWPQHHRPTTFLPLEVAIEESENGSKTVWVGEVEPLQRMKGMAGICMDPGRSYFKAKVRLYNRTSVPQVFMWWANIAVSANESYRTVFPPDVEWVNDHDRRAVLSWPIAKGVFRTARPYDYGDGKDISKYDSVIVPSSFMVSQGQSEMDFLAGYDSGKNRGMVTVANHHIVPGKKLWTWGLGEFAEMWCSNLSDENGPYIELMSGAYTDNQPDFTWIAPYETCEFEQFWYGVRDIGDVKNATIDAAMNMEKRGSDLFVGFNVTGSFPNCTIKVTDGATVLFTDVADLAPEYVYTKTIGLNGHLYENITVSLISADGDVLVDYTPYVCGQKQPIIPREAVRRPSEIESMEELYINALHLEQYKQHNYDARDYYMEALQRDENDSRCNTGMARISLKNGKFEECVAYSEKAIKRLTLRNEHPADTEAFYLKGIALFYLGRDKEAYDTLYRAGWNYTYKSAAYYMLAILDCRAGRFSEALEKLDISYCLNNRHNCALLLRATILRHLNRKNEAKKLAFQVANADILDLWAQIETNYYEDRKLEILSRFGGKPEYFLDVVCHYMEAGFIEEALAVLDTFKNDYPLMPYYQAFCLAKLNKNNDIMLKKAAGLETGCCFPSRLEDVNVLKYAIENNPEDANACYYLGCLFYDRFRYDEAINCWELSVHRAPNHVKSLRNLSIAYFDKRNDWLSAKVCMEKAIQNLADPRLLYEYQQLLKNSNVSIDERLCVYDQYPDLLQARDDCYLDYIILLCQKGNYKEAISLAAVRHFHIYEGGEGKLTKQHAWMHVLFGNQLAKEGKYAEAKQAYLAGVDVPRSYGEAKTYYNQEAHLFYFLGLLLEGNGQIKEAIEAFEEASTDKTSVSEISLFRALALRRLGRFTQAEYVLNEMLTNGKKLIEDKDLRGYFGVGTPTPMPFEYDIVRQNLTNAHLLNGFALLGLGRKLEADAEISKAKEHDPHHFQIYTYEQIRDLI